MLKPSYLNALKRIYQEPRTVKDLGTGEMNHTQHLQHTMKYLGELEQLGYCVQTGEYWLITPAGKAAVEEKKEDANKAERVTSWGMSGTYAGEELGRLSHRPGAYDFLNKPSRYFETRIYRKDAA